MADRAPQWVVPVMRAGYAARGAVYVLIGGIALVAAWSGGQAEGPKGALSSMRDEPWEMALLWAIGVGFFCYAAWRVIAAWMDLERHGSDGKGMAARAALVVTGVVHAALGIYAIRLAHTGSGGSQDGQSEQRWTAWLMSQTFGKWLVVAVGLIVIGAGVYYAWKGISEKYKEHLRYTPTVERLDTLCKFGLIAYGLVIGIVGGFLVWAGWTSNPSEAGGIEQAFSTVRQAAFGRVLLGILALGMVAFAIENVIEAIYRVVPARAGGGCHDLGKPRRSRRRPRGVFCRRKDALSDVSILCWEQPPRSCARGRACPGYLTHPGVASSPSGPCGPVTVCGRHLAPGGARAPGHAPDAAPFAPQAARH